MKTFLFYCGTNAVGQQRRLYAVGENSTAAFNALSPEHRAIWAAKGEFSVQVTSREKIPYLELLNMKRKQSGVSHGTR